MCSALPIRASPDSVWIAEAGRSGTRAPRSAPGRSSANAGRNRTANGIAAPAAVLLVQNVALTASRT